MRERKVQVSNALLNEEVYAFWKYLESIGESDKMLSMHRLLLYGHNPSFDSFRTPAIIDYSTFVVYRKFFMEYYLRMKNRKVVPQPCKEMLDALKSTKDDKDEMLLLVNILHYTESVYTIPDTHVSFNVTWKEKAFAVEEITRVLDSIDPSVMDEAMEELKRLVACGKL